MRFFFKKKQKKNPKQSTARARERNIFRRKRGEVDSTFGFVRGPVLSAALRNVLEAKIAQNLVEVGGVDEHVLNGEALHGARCVPTLAARLQPPVESGLGAAAFDAQTRSGGGGRGVSGGVGVGGWSESGGCGSETEEKTEMGILERRFCPSLRALPRRCAALCRRCSADVWTSIFARSHRLLRSARPRPPPHKHTPSFLY